MLIFKICDSNSKSINYQIEDKKTFINIFTNK